MAHSTKARPASPSVQGAGAHGDIPSPLGGEERWGVVAIDSGLCRIRHCGLPQSVANGNLADRPPPILPHKGGGIQLQGCDADH